MLTRLDPRPLEHNDHRQERGFRSLNDAWADTMTAHGRLMLTVLDGLAEFERELILLPRSTSQRTAAPGGVRPGGHGQIRPTHGDAALRWYLSPCRTR
ncbi:MAG: recombinase family protein [Alphaproteobacteria bacterium]